MTWTRYIASIAVILASVLLMAVATVVVIG